MFYLTKLFNSSKELLFFLILVRFTRISFKNLKIVKTIVNTVTLSSKTFSKSACGLVLTLASHLSLLGLKTQCFLCHLSQTQSLSMKKL